MTKEAAGRLFSKGLNCAQSVFASQSDKTGISVTDSLKLATGFGGGMAMMQKTCGLFVEDAENILGELL